MKKNKLSSEEVYNYSTIRNITVVFGSLFSNFHVRNYNADGTISKKVTVVPLHYSAKDQYGLWLEQQMRLPTGNIEIGTKLPRISFEMSGFSFAPEKGINTNIPIFRKTLSSDGYTLKSNAPISYKFDFNLTIWAKQMDDSIQILDQILPLFAPEISVKIKESKKLQIYNDITIILQSVSKNDNYQSGFDENRFISWDLQFTLYANIMPTPEKISVIREVIVETAEDVSSKYVNGELPPFMRPPVGVNIKEYTVPPRRNNDTTFN